MFLFFVLVLAVTNCLKVEKWEVSGKKFAVREFSTTYNDGNSKINGYEPTESGTFPLHVWVTGTSMTYWDEDDMTYTNFMASSGFVSGSLDYPNSAYPVACSGFQSKAASLFDITNPQSALNVLCDMSNVDCQKGIVISGFSQGAQLVSLAANYGYNDLIRGIYEMGGGDKLYTGQIIIRQYPCLKYNQLLIDKLRIRSMVGENDGYFGYNINGVRDEQISITNYTNCLDNNPSSSDCIQSDGSGWYIITSDETSSGLATHCYAYLDSSCSNTQFDNNYYPNCPNCKWSLQNNYQWLIDQIYN